MRTALPVAAMILLYTLQSLLCKKYSDHYPGKGATASPVFTVVSGFTVVLLSLVLTGFQITFSPSTVLLALLNAAALVGYNAFLIGCAQTGAYSVMMVFSIAGGIALPCAVGVIFFGDPLSPLKLISLLVIFVAVFLVSYRPGEALSRSKLFLPFCVGLGVCNGAYGALLDVQQRLTGTAEREEMVALTYLVATVIALVMLVLRERRGTLAAFRQTKRSLFYLAVCAVVVALAVHVMVYIIPLIDVTVLYTFDNAGVFLCSVLASAIFFGERLKPLNAIGCALMCAALVGTAIF